jgi:hypothetical protein
MARMELWSKPSRSASQRRKLGRGWSVFAEAIRHYSQTSTTTTPGQLNPSDLQVGQSVYDNLGKEQIVVESPQGEAQKTLMPKDQQGKPVPTVKTVDDPDLAAQYNLQPTTPGSPKQVQQPTARRRRSSSEDEAWARYQDVERRHLREIQPGDLAELRRRYMVEEGGEDVELQKGEFVRVDDIVEGDSTNGEVAVVHRYPDKPFQMWLNALMWRESGDSRQAAYADEDDPYYDSPESMNRSTAEDWMTMPAGQTNIENWQDLGGGGDVVRYDPTRSRERSETSPPEESGPTRPVERTDKKRHEGLIAKLMADVGGMDEFAETSSPLTHGESWGSEEDALRFGEAGYVDIMNSIKDMIHEGCSTIDVLLRIGEMYPREIATRVLS